MFMVIPIIQLGSNLSTADKHVAEHSNSRVYGYKIVFI